MQSLCRKHHTCSIKIVTHDFSRQCVLKNLHEERKKSLTLLILDPLDVFLFDDYDLTENLKFYVNCNEHAVAISSKNNVCSSYIFCNKSC